MQRATRRRSARLPATCTRPTSRDLLEALEPEDRDGLVRLLGDDFDFTALTELDETVRIQILEALPPNDRRRGRRANSIPTTRSTSSRTSTRRTATRSSPGLPSVERAALMRSLDYPEGSAGRLMQTDFIAVPPFWTVGRAIDYMREAERTAGRVHRTLRRRPALPPARHGAARPAAPLQAPDADRRHHGRDRHTVHATDDQEDVARLFERYNLVSAPVVDEADRLVGVITVDDIVDVIEEEAEEDIRRLAGVGDEEISDTVV